MDIRTKEAVRYLGYGKHAVDDRVLQLIQESFKELEQLAEPKCIYRIFELSVTDTDKIKIGTMSIDSKHLQKNLKHCKEVVLLGATLGTGVDRALRKYEITDITKAVVLQACATAYLEEYLDNKQETMAQLLQAEDKYLRPRFSPGYGDFSILYQKEILQMLDAPKLIGLSMTDGAMLTPTKSVTAVIGISKIKAPCHRKGCEECTKTDCVYRRSE